jgi:hypothetical protein
MRFLTGILLLAVFTHANGQTSINVDDTTMRNNSTFFNTVDGIPVMNPKYTRIVEGSLYEPANFTKAMVFLKNGKRGLGVEGRINVMDERLHYLDGNGKEKYADSKIEEIQFFENDRRVSAFSFGIAGCPTAPHGCYEILEKGKANLHRKVIKLVNENKPYGSATTEQKVITKYSYFLSNDTSCRQIKNINDLQNELIRTDTKMRTKLPTHNLSDKKVEDWTELVKIFNTL